MAVLVFLKCFFAIIDLVPVSTTLLLFCNEKHNFVALIETCKGLDFHIHTHTFNEILLCKSNEIIYICDNCNE